VSRKESPWDDDAARVAGDIDQSLKQLVEDATERVVEEEESTNGVHVKIIHPTSIEQALSITCRVSPSSASSAVGSAQASPHRTKEDVLALAQDKHERALVSQVVSPQDIGVSYDMIGGLFEVKELLRQSITYPLKFPHLYNEGIAKEAVKGVLLFGPPGTGKVRYISQCFTSSPKQEHVANMYFLFCVLFALNTFLPFNRQCWRRLWRRKVGLVF
jgi:SpoVK/Ycf46/Vps4 family AAA+-type ATPase